MPSNLVTINYSEELEYIVPDSKMDKVISVLKECGDKHYPISSDISALPYSQNECQPLPSPQVVCTCP